MALIHTLLTVLVAAALVVRVSCANAERVIKKWDPEGFESTQKISNIVLPIHNNDRLNRESLVIRYGGDNDAVNVTIVIDNDDQWHIFCNATQDNAAVPINPNGHRWTLMETPVNIMMVNTDTNGRKWNMDISLGSTPPQNICKIKDLTSKTAELELMADTSRTFTENESPFDELQVRYVGSTESRSLSLKRY